MEFNRNQLFLIGLILVFFGIQFRKVEAFVLNEPCSRFVEKRLPASKGDTSSESVASAPQHRELRPPEWLGLCLVSVGAVLTLQALAMRKPGG